MIDIKKALDILALQNLEGKLSDDLLSKACDNYKLNSDFIEDYDYHVKVSKSISDYLNDIETDEEILKALVPGQTKVVDGIVYIYTATPNAKTMFDWRVYKPNAGSKQIGRQVTDSQAGSKSAHVNDLFPVDLSSLTVIKRLGGSTGAQLVEDSRGDQYVMKKGSNTSNEHLESEYLVNQLYDLMGYRVPDYEMYDDNGDKVMLSRFIPLTKMPTSSDQANMAQGFIVDALFANWDIYMNDNCLIDSAGRVIRVDSGGALKFRAQGGAKPSFGNKVTDYDSMIKYNPFITSVLSDEDIIKQIDDALSKKDDLIGYLNSGVKVDSDLEGIFKGRFKDLERIKGEIQSKLDQRNRPPKPRVLKPEVEMYRDFTADEIKAFWADMPQSDYSSKLSATGNNGWELLSNICKERGFDGRPLVVDEDEYWKSVGETEYQIFRGLAPDRGKSAEEFMNHFKHSDDCFYGTLGAYGAGIYAHINDGKNADKSKSGYKKSPAWDHAENYARSWSSSGPGGILEMTLDKSAKVAMVDDLRDEIKTAVLDENDPNLVKANDELKAATAEFDRLSSDLHNISDTVEKQMKADMNWNENVLVMHQAEIDNIDWGKVDENGDPDYPKFDSFVKGSMFDWVKDNGGKVTSKGGKGQQEYYVMELPNSKSKFEISKYQWENNAIKRQNAFATPYSYPVKRFQGWLMKNHYQLIDKKVQEKLGDMDEDIKALQTKVSHANVKVKEKHQEVQKLKSVKSPNSNMMAGIYEHVTNNHTDYGIGVYAALKGYDALIQPKGNGNSNSFMVILNRTKVIVKK